MTMTVTNKIDKLTFCYWYVLTDSIQYELLLLDHGHDGTSLPTDVRIEEPSSGEPYKDTNVSTRFSGSTRRSWNWTGKVKALDIRKFLYAIYTISSNDNDLSKMGFIIDSSTLSRQLRLVSNGCIPDGCSDSNNGCSETSECYPNRKIFSKF